MPSYVLLLAPLIALTAGGAATLAAEPFLDRRAKHAWLPWLAALALVATGIALALVPRGAIDGILVIDDARRWLGCAVLGATLIGVAGLQLALDRDEHAGGEPYALALFAALGGLLMVLANDGVALFIGVEIASLAVYCLVGLRRDRAESRTGLFHYFVMGGVFSAVLLYGLALTYGATGSTHFGQAPVAGRWNLLIAGQALMIIGLLFKIGAVPFHFWSPEAYRGAPAAVTGLMGAVIKIGGITALGALWLNLLAQASGQHPGTLYLDSTMTLSAAWRTHAGLVHLEKALLAVGLVSILLGNFAALRARNVRRLIAFSSVSHAGFMLLALAVPRDEPGLHLGSLWFYAAGYAVSTAGLLVAISALSGRDDNQDDLKGLSGQGRAAPLYGLAATVFLVSAAGLPPTAGFLGKFLVLSDLVTKGWWPLALAAMVLAVIGAAYYLRLVVQLWGGEGRERPAPLPVLATAAVVLAATTTVAFIACAGWFVAG
jgi:NADH-quinone oxidoreductase subunit N